MLAQTKQMEQEREVMQRRIREKSIALKRQQQDAEDQLENQRIQLL